MNYFVNTRCVGNTVLNVPSKVIDISDRLIPTPPSNYTSQGHRKCTPCEPIRDPKEIQTIKDYLRNNGKPSLRLRNYTLFVLGISIGIRTHDLLNIRVRDVLHANGYIVDEISVFESKTHKMNHPILNEEAQAALAEYLNSMSDYSPSDFLFRAEGRDTPMKPNSLYKIFVKVREALGLTYTFGVNSMRKTFAYGIIAQHPNDVTVLATLQEMLNHDSMKTTLHYSGQTRDDLRRMYQSTAKMVDGTAEYKTIETKKANDVNADDIVELKKQVDFIVNRLCPDTD